MKNYKILWIDDDVDNPELQPERDALEDWDFSITPVKHPDDLVFENIPSYNCIIIDLAMPIGSKLTPAETQYGSRTGFALLKRIKKQYPGSIVVVYSVFDVAEVRQYCNENGIRYLIKSRHLADDFAKNIVETIIEKGAL